MEVKFIVEMKVSENEKEVLKELKRQGDWVKFGMSTNGRESFTLYKNEFTSLRGAQNRLNLIDSAGVEKGGSNV